MKNILIVTAHPAEWGFTHKIADRYKKTTEELGHEVKIIDLYHSATMLDFLTFKKKNPSESVSQNELEDQQSIKSIQADISWANELVFVWPIWWGGPPGIAKNMFDNVFQSGFSHKYTQEGKLQKLLKGKTARVFTTADGPNFLYTLMRFWYWVWWGQVVFGYCGIKLESITIFTNMVKKKNDKARNKMLAKVAKIAQAK